MSILIANMPQASELKENHLLIVEARDEGNISIETQKATLGDIYRWLSTTKTNRYNINPEQVKTSGANLERTIDEENGEAIIGFKITTWDQSQVYNVGDVVNYNDCLYLCIAQTAIAMSAPNINIDYWDRMGYKIGKYLTLTPDNTLNASGVENWVSGRHYDAGDFVVYNKRLYQRDEVAIPEEDPSYDDVEWIEDHWINIGEGNGIIPYKNNKYYDADSIVLYNGRLYQRLTSGNDINGWEPSHWKCVSNGDFANVFIKYSHNYPTTNADMTDNPDAYMGIYVGPSDSTPSNFNRYKWYRIKGADGTINVEANTVIISITLLATDWSNSTPSTQTISNNNLTANMSPIIDLTYSNDATLWESEENQYSLLTRAVCNDGSITFYCKGDKPTEDINLKLRINGDVNAQSFVTKTEFNLLKNEVESILGDANNLLETTLEGN